MFKFGNIARQRFVQSNLVDNQISATVFMLKSDIVRSPGIDTSNYGAELYHLGEVGVSLQNPYSQNWSHYFDGPVSRAYVYLQNTLNLTLGSGNWTVEFWTRFYDTALDTTTRRVMATGSTADIATGWSIEVADQQYTVSGYIVPRGGLIFRNNTQILGTTTAVNDGRWHHVAWSKVGATLYCFLDGVQQGSVVFAYNLNATGDIIVGKGLTGSQMAFEGYISNVRITAGTGLYSSNFTVPTSRLTTTTNTMALFMHRGLFAIEESMYQQAVRRSGEPVWQKNVGPFPDDPAVQQAISLNYMPQRSGYSLSLPDGRYVLGTADFCIEFWFKPTYGQGTTNNTHKIFSMGNLSVYWYIGAGTDGISLSFGAPTPTYTAVPGGGDAQFSYSYQSWNHVYISRTAGWIQIFLNGVRRYGGSPVNDLANVLGAQYLALGPWQNYTVNTIGGAQMIGYNVGNPGGVWVCDLRIVVGSGLLNQGTTSTTASNFITVPTSPINTNSNWRGLTTSSYIVYAGFGAQHVKNNRMPINTGYGYQTFMATTVTTYATPAISSGPYNQNDYGAMGTFTPFGTHGWSAYFTGTYVVNQATQDFISLPLGKAGAVNTSTGIGLDLLRSSYNTNANVGFTNFTNGHDFTVECWFQCATVITNNVIFNLNSVAGGYANLFVYTTGTQMGLGMAATSAAWAINTGSLGSTGTVLPNVWYHLAVVKNSQTVRLFLNGNDLTAPYFNPVTNTTGGLVWSNTQTGVTSYTQNYIGAAPLAQPGAGQTITSMTGFISNVRILVGQALYTGPFVPAVNRPLRLTQDQAFNQQRLFYPTDNTGASLAFYSTTKGQGQTFSSGTSILAVPTAQSTWNTSTWSTSTTATSWTGLVMGNGDWTIEGWIYPEQLDVASVSSQRVPLFTVFGTGTTAMLFHVKLVMGSQNTIAVPGFDINNISSPSGLQPTGWPANGGAWNGGWWPTATSTTVVPFYRWSHIAATRYNGTWQLYLNGERVLNVSTGSSYNMGQPIGQVVMGMPASLASAPDSHFIGMMSNWRIVQGQALYTATFTATNVTFNTSTVGMVGPNIATTLTGLVVFLGAQDQYGSQGYIPGDGAFRRHVAIINSGTLSNGTTSSQHYAITEKADAATIFPRLFGPVGCHPSVLTLASKTFEDLSLNTQTVTKTQYSNVRLTPFAPFKTPTAHNPTVNGGSYYFNGLNGLVTPGAYHQNFSTKDFTMETWVYLDIPLNNSKVNYLFDTGISTLGTRIRIDATGQLSFRNVADTALLTSPATVILHSGAWYHLAWTRRNGVSSMWINGKNYGTATDTTNYYDYRYYNAGVTLGVDAGLLSTTGFVGYMASTRIVNDYAMYTQEFTPPTRSHSLTTNTYVLLNFNNYAQYDPSQKNNISIIGDIRTLNDESPYANAWSYSFDGGTTGNFINANNHDYVPIQGSGGSLLFGNGDFTFEGWYNVLELQGRGNNTADTYHTIIDYHGHNDATQYVTGGGAANFTAQYFKVLIANSGTVVVGIGGGAQSGTGLVYNPYPILWGPTNTATTMMVTVSSWTHIAVVRQTGTLKLFINGYNVGETLNQVQWHSTATELVYAAGVDYIPRPIFGTTGYQAGSYYAYDGYMSNVRIVKGLAVYTTSTTGTNVQQFIPSINPLTTATTSGTNIQAVPGLGLYGSSQWFTSSTFATTNFVSTPIAAGFDLVTNAFTIEGWAQYQLTTGTYQTLFSLGTNGSNRIALYTTNTGYTLQFNAIVGGVHTINMTGPIIINTFTSGLYVTLPNPSIQIIQGQPQTVYAITTSSSSNRWFHWAVTKDAAGTAGTIRLFVNGQLYASGTSGTWFADGSNYMAFGFDPFTGSTSTGHNLTGYLSNVRVTKGQALYLNTFTPPTSGYIGSSVGSTGANVPATITGTISLIAFNTSTLRDLSANNYALSSTGNTVVDNSFGPFGWSPGLVLFNNRTLTNSGLNTVTTLVNTINGGSPKPALYVPYPAYNTPLQLGNRSLFFTGGFQSQLGIGYNAYQMAYVKVVDQPHHQFGEGVFTIELWFLIPYEYRGGNGGYRRTLISKGGSPTADSGSGSIVRGWWLGLENTIGGKLAFTWDNNIIRSTNTPIYNSWNHVVVQRENTGTQGLKLFMNGVLEAAGTMPQTVNTQTFYGNYTPSSLLIGIDHHTTYSTAISSDQFIGYIDDVRMTFGIARYANTTTITVPTAYNNER